ncbi:hypothetical protein L479_02342 [Exiguobacterium sp. S17]|nr:hypothetical protein L479_02342 [Exiguobacterium sp. S17]
MAQIYFKLILAGKRTIDSVPEHLREAVQVLLDEHDAQATN